VKATSVAEVLALYERWGRDHYDEALSQLDHALQTAAFGLQDGAADELVVAALLHDVGHLLELEVTGPDGDRSTDLHHESVGARYLSDLFAPEVTSPIALHVRAKRYLCTVDPAYANRLSAGSRRSLERQGGSLDRQQVTAFEAVDGFDGAVALRRWDDAGKVEDLAVPQLDTYRPLLERLARGSAA
jgi:phosphonate degradation associated HDIG domain protein